MATTPTISQLNPITNEPHVPHALAVEGLDIEYKIVAIKSFIENAHN